MEANDEEMIIDLHELKGLSDMQLVELAAELRKYTEDKDSLTLVLRELGRRQREVK